MTLKLDYHTLRELPSVTQDGPRRMRTLDVAALGELAVAGIAIDLQDPLEAVEMGDRPLGLAVGA